MYVRFLSDGSDSRSYGGGSFSNNRDKGGIFWWAILITLLVGAATFCWFFSIMVFSHPEKPFNYKILAKFNKLEPLRPYTIWTAPQGKFLSARNVLSEFFPYSAEQMAVRNDLLKRSYIRNYKHEQPVYLTGAYRVVSARALTGEDVVTSGWVVRARSADLEDVDVEIVLPGLATDKEPYRAGDPITLNQKNTFASTVHVQRLDEDRMCITVIPLAYQGFTSDKLGAVKLSPPDHLNMAGFWPITHDPGSGDPNTPAQPGQQVAVKN